MCNSSFGRLHLWQTPTLFIGLSLTNIIMTFEIVKGVLVTDRWLDQSKGYDEDNHIWLKQDSTSVATPVQIRTHTVTWAVKEFQDAQGGYKIPSRSSNCKMGQNLGHNLCGLFSFV